MSGKGRGHRTYILLIINNFINKLSGTDGIRTIGRPWHASLLNDSSLREAICWSTRNRPPLPRPTMIRLPPPLTIRGFHLCLATFTPQPILAGKSRLQNGEQCFSGSSMENHSVRSPMNMAYHMSQSGECCMQRVAETLGPESTDSPRGQYISRFVCKST